MKTVFSAGGGFFFVLCVRARASMPESERFLGASPEHVGVPARCDKFQAEHLQQSTLNHNSGDPIRRPVLAADDGSGSARLTLPAECHLNCPAADAAKTRHLGTS